MQISPIAVVCPAKSLGFYYIEAIYIQKMKKIYVYDS